MNKEKEIEEMVKAQKGVCKQVKQSCGCCKHGKLGICEYNESYRRAKMLVEAGYRKADEVRKEMAKELFDLIEEEYKRAEMLSGNDIHFKCGVLDGLCDILDMFHQKFGFEVDE